MSVQIDYITEPEKVGRIGLSVNEHNTVVTVFICEVCGALFTVTGDVTDERWGKGCLAEECDSYDVTRDVDLMFGIEPWRIRRDDDMEGDEG